jgi:hypothetical protein
MSSFIVCFKCGKCMIFHTTEVKNGILKLKGIKVALETLRKHKQIIEK